MRRILGYVVVALTFIFIGLWVAADLALTGVQPGTPIAAAKIDASFHALTEGKQARVAEGCPEGSAIRTIGVDGSVVCEPIENERLGLTVVARNAGDPLEPGSVVAFSGVARPVSLGGVATARVVAAYGTATPGVAGVVERRFDPYAARELGFGGRVEAGEHLLLVVAGPAVVRARAAWLPIRPGDPLVVSSATGVATRADEALAELRAAGWNGTLPPGAVFAKALEPLPLGREGRIWVFVTGF